MGLLIQRSDSRCHTCLVFEHYRNPPDDRTGSVNIGMRGMMVGVETAWLFKNLRKLQTDVKTMNNSSGITFHIWFSAFVPLLPKCCLVKTTHSKMGETNLVAHLLVLEVHAWHFSKSPSPYLHFFAPEKSSWIMTTRLVPFVRSFRAACTRSRNL